MTRVTLSDFRSQFPTEFFGVCKADPKVIEFCNQAQELLMIDPLAPENGWWGMWVKMRFTIQNDQGHAYVTTPREVARLTDIALCDRPMAMRNAFYEFLEFSRGLLPKTCSTCNNGPLQTLDQDNVVTLADLNTTEAQTLRFYPTDSRDSGLRVLPQGLDANGQTILTTDPNTGLSAPGEYVSLTFPFVDTANTFTKLTGLLKDQTYGPVQIYQVGATTGEVILSSMQPNEMVANYRRYLISGIPATRIACCNTTTGLQLNAMARLDFIPVQNEIDFLTIPNVPALIEEAKAIHFRNIDNGGALAEQHHARAISLLCGQLDAQTGKTNVAVAVSLFGSRPLRPSFR